MMIFCSKDVVVAVVSHVDRLFTMRNEPLRHLLHQHAISQVSLCQQYVDLRTLTYYHVQFEQVESTPRPPATSLL